MYNYAFPNYTLCLSLTLKTGYPGNFKPFWNHLKGGLYYSVKKREETKLCILVDLFKCVDSVEF